MTDLIGETFGSYKLTGYLEKGGFAEVYLGEHVHLKSLAAVKILRKAHLTEQRDKERFLEEARIIAALKHPHIVPILDFGIKDEENIPFYVMEYAALGSLRKQHPEDSRLPLSQINDYVKQIANALQYAHHHKKGVIHCDIKPENMLLGSQNDVWLSDFGIAVLLHPTTPIDRRMTIQPDILVGSLEYMAPERIEGQPCPASDQYSLGIVVYEWLCGHPPFEFQGNDISLLIQHMDASPPSLCQQDPTIPLAVEQVVLKTLEKKLEDRYGSVIEFCEELQRASNSAKRASAEAPAVGAPTVILSPPPSSLPRGGALPTTKKWIMVYIIVILVSMLLAASLSWVGRSILDKQSPLSLQPPVVSTEAPSLTCRHRLTVTSGQNDASGSFRKMLSKAQDGDCILFPSHQERIELTQNLEIPINVRIEAPMAHQITFTPQKPDITIHVHQGKTVTFRNIDFQGNDIENTTFIINEQGNLSIINSRISHLRSAYDGGALSNLNGTLTLTQCEIDHNQTLQNGGGAISNVSGTLILDQCKIHDNRANYNGGGIYSLNGQVFIQNDSSITANNILRSLEGSDVGGGGGMTLHGGTVFISNSSLEDNISAGNGGGILLRGASALIYQSRIQHNQTYTTQTGGIAVETNSENNHRSFLVLAGNSLVQFNSNSQSSNTPLANIQGQIVDKDAESMSINSDPHAPQPPSDPTTFKQFFLGYLTPEHFRTYCQSQHDSHNQPFTDMIPSLDTQTITCRSNNGETLQLSTQNGSVNQVCTMLQPNSKHTLARLFRNGYWTWQCFQEQHLLLDITKPVPSTRSIPLNSFCASTGGSLVLMPKHDGPPNAYDWSCKQGTDLLPISMDIACQQVTGNPFALANLVDHSKPDSWQCWGPDSTK
ncbi:MAG: hypothetical protein E6J34_16580 [Chloroflexi bacterium]|nr:MAG: hypothetical protein E6J34_16580 [Chloroflexota bacterium]